MKASSVSVVFTSRGFGVCKNCFVVGTLAKMARPQGKSIVLEHYEVVEGKKGLLGEGSFSVVHKGKDLRTGQDVAIKTYKAVGGSKKQDDEEYKLVVTKFKRQIDVLKSLMAPLEKLPADPKLRNDILLKMDPKKMFLELLDYSKDKKGEPGPDAKDGKMYVITEVADYSMKDYLAARNEQGAPLSYETIRSISKSFIAVIAMLHAKGLVHLDIKPENMMRAGKHWKLIDVDGCTQIGQKININDSTISFSPCYCAPEWANFLIEDAEYLKVTAGLDVWSVAISLLELIMLDAVLKPKYGAIYRQCGSHRKAGFLFLEWLANMDESLGLDKKIIDGHKDERYKADHAEYYDLIVRDMLEKKADKRWSLAEALNHKFIKDVSFSGFASTSSAKDDKEVNMTEEEKRIHAAAAAKRRNRTEEKVTEQPPILKGVLSKLNADGDLRNKDHWNKRDVWLSADGAICYFSVKKHKRMVLVDAQQILRSTVTKVDAGKKPALEWAFELRSAAEGADSVSDAPYDSQFYACESEKDLSQWMKVLNDVIGLKYQDVDTKVLISKGLIDDYRDFKIHIRNRREKIDDVNAREFKPVFKCDLWKLNQEGDPMNEDHWLKREMWIAKNGSLCYFSKKENRELQYFKPDDIRVVGLEKVTAKESCKPHTFILQLPPVDGLEYAPAMFAAQTPEEEKTFLAYIKKFQKLSAERGD